MIAARSSRCSSTLARRSSRSTSPLVGSPDHDDLHAGHHRGRRVGAVRAGRDQADGARALPVGPVVGADRQQPGELALRAGVGLQRHGVVAGDLAQPRLELADQLEVAGGLLDRRERVHRRELRPGDRLHLGGGVELHRAGAERDHRPVQREVLVRELAQVAQHRGLGPVRVEHRVGEDLVVAQQLGGQPVLAPPAGRRRTRSASAPNAAQTAARCSRVVVSSRGDRRRGRRRRGAG